jgi:DNA polymerase III delta prime subunit
MDDIVGIDSAVAAVESAIERYDGKTHLFLLVLGPPGSGKTTVVSRALELHKYHVYNPTPGDTLSKELSRMASFCNTRNTVQSLINCEKDKRKAIFIDDILPDVKSVCAVVDSVKKLARGTLVVACAGRSFKAPTVTRRASATARFEYPSLDVTVGYLLRRFEADGIHPDAVRRCAENADCCVPRAAQLCIGELYGTKSVACNVVDCSIFEYVKRAVTLVVDGRGFKEVEAAVSSEPSMSAMILRESTPRPSPETRRAILDLSKTPPGTWIGSVSSTVCFMEIALRERDHLRSAKLLFPRCYTMASSRACSLKKLAKQRGLDAETRQDELDTGDWVDG